MSEYGVTEAEGVSPATHKIEVAEFVKGLGEALDGGHAGAEPS